MFKIANIKLVSSRTYSAWHTLLQRFHRCRVVERTLSSVHVEMQPICTVGNYGFKAAILIRMNSAIRDSHIGRNMIFCLKRYHSTLSSLSCGAWIITCKHRSALQC
jgi:hypothetical protein